MAAVVVADDARWSLFRHSLSGEAAIDPDPPAARIVRAIRHRATQVVQTARLGRIVQKSCSEHNIPVWRTFDVNEASFLRKVEDTDIDLIISAAFPQIFSKALISIPSLGSVNFHPSLLPKYRGAHPHFWAIAKGESESGISAHFMTERLDDGDIIAQIPFSIADLSYHQLYDKMVSETPRLVTKVETFFFERSATALPQDSTQATYFRNDRDIHHRIFWDIKSAEDIKNLTRTGTAYCFFRNSPVRFNQVYITDTNRNLTNDVAVTPGTIVDFSNDALVVKAIDGCVSVQALENGRRRYGVDKWIRKHRVRIGERFQ